MSVHPDLPVKTMAELVAYAKANPGKLSWGSQGFGVAPHLLLELFKLEAGVNIVHVPYRGTAPMLTAIVAGEVQVVADPMTTSLPHIQSGKLRAMPSPARTHVRNCPMCRPRRRPAIRRCNSPFWLGVVAPAGTPPAIVDKLNAAFRESLAPPETRARLANARRRDQDRHAGRVRQNARRGARAVDRRREGRQDQGGMIARLRRHGAATRRRSLIAFAPKTIGRRT